MVGVDAGGKVIIVNKDLKGRVVKTSERVAYLVPILLGVLFGVCSFVGVHGGRLEIRNIILYADVIFFAALFVIIFHGAIKLVKKIKRHPCNLDTPFDFCKHLKLDWSLKSVIVSWGIISICWIPYAIIFFPGTYWFDTSWQLVQFFDPNTPITDHHPFALTYLLGFFAVLGKSLLDNAVYGLYILVILQTAVSALSLASITCYLTRFKVPWKIRFIVIAFFALFPFLPCLAMSLAKDTIATPFFVFFSIMFCEIWMTRGNVLASPLFDVLLIVDIVFASAVKKTGMYVIMLSLLLLAFIVKTWLMKAGVVTIALIPYLTVGLIAPTFIFPVLHIEPGENSEMLAVPMQQVANVVRNHPSSLSNKELDEIQEIYQQDTERLRGAYCWYVSDPIKGQRIPPEDVHKLGKLWLRQLLTHPTDMAAGWAGLSASWFSFAVASKDGAKQNSMVVLSGSSHHHPGVNQFMSWPDSTKGGQAFGRFYEQTLLTLPIAGVLFQKALWASILPFFLIFVSVRSRSWWRMLILNMPIMVTLLTLVAGPTSAYGEAVRYVLPLVYTLPLFLCISLSLLEQGEPEQ